MSFKGVEIDIRMRQNVEKEARKSKKGIDSLSDATRKMQQELKENVAIQKQVLKQLRSELSALEKDFKKVNFGSSDPKLNAEKMRLGKSVRFLRNEIKLEEEALKGLEKQQQSYTSKTNNLETEIRNVRNEMAALKMQGRENTQEYKVLEERLGLLGTAYKELSATQKALSTGGTQMAGILSGLNAVSGAFTATAGAMGMVNSSSENMEKMQTRIQSMMAITIGLQQVSNTLHKTSAFRITTVTKVKELWAIANTKVATTLGITNVQAQILMGTLTLGLSVAITAIVIAIDRYITTQREAAVQTKKFNESVSESTAASLANYEQLRKSYNKLGDDLKEKEQFVIDNQSAFKDLGIAILNVNDANNAFINQTDAIRQAFKERAKAAAYYQLQIEKYKEKIQLQLELEKQPNSVFKYPEINLPLAGLFNYRFSYEMTNNEKIPKLLKDIESKDKEIGAISEKMTESTKKAADLFEDAQIKRLEAIEKYSKKWWEVKKSIAEAQKNQLSDKDIGSEKWQKLEKDIQAADKVLSLFNKKKPTTGSLEQATERLKRLGSDMESEINATVLATMKEGKQKRLAQIDEEHRQRVQKIEKYKKETLQLEKFIGKKAPERREQINQWQQEEDKRHKAKRKAIEDAHKKETEEEWEKLLKKYATYEQQKTALAERYAKDRKRFEDKNKGGKFDGNLKQLNKAEANDLFELEKKAKGTKNAIADIFSDLSDKSVAEMQNILQHAKALFAFLKAGKFVPNNAFGLTQEQFKAYSSPDSLKALGDSITKTDELIKKSDKSFKAFKKDVNDLFSGKLTSSEFERKLARVQSKIQAASELANMFADSLRAIGELSGDELFGDIANGIADVTEITDKTMSGAATGFMLGGPVGAAIGAGLGLVSGILGKIGASAKRHREALQQIRLAEIAEQQTYNKLLWEQKMLMEDAESIFGVDALSKALGYLEAYNQSFAQLQEKLRKKPTRENYLGGLFGLTHFKSELDKIEVVTGHRRGGLFRRAKTYYTSITKLYDDLINKEGELNVVRARAILKTRKMRDEDKMRLEEIIQLYEQQKEAQKALNENLKETFGELGDGLMDSIINSLKTGEDAFESFAKNVGNVMGKLGKQIMYELFISSKFKDLQKQLTDVYQNSTVYKTVKGGLFGMGTKKVKDNEATLKNIGKKAKEAIASFANNVKGDISLMQEFAKMWQKGTKELGFDVWSNEDTKRQGASKGIAQASQDSIDDVLGRLYTLVRFVNEIRTNEQLAQITNTQAVSIKSAMLAQLIEIAKNTEYNKYLKDLADDIEEIKQHGIKLKAS